MKRMLVVSLILLLAGCNLPRPSAVQAPVSSEEQVPPSVITESLPTETPVLPYQQCYWNWATRPLPELSAQVLDAMEAAGLSGVTVRAEEYGENCYDPQTNDVVGFAAMETDFRLRVEVTDLSDRDLLGSLLERILIVLDGFPMEAIPGTQPGYIGITFFSGEDLLNLWFTVIEGQEARAQGLHNAALLDFLMK